LPEPPVPVMPRRGVVSDSASRRIASRSAGAAVPASSAVIVRASRRRSPPRSPASSAAASSGSSRAISKSAFATTSLIMPCRPSAAPSSGE